jgi:predicted dehydrogenase
VSAGGAPLGLGVVGCGTIARYQHAPHLARATGARLVAVADPDPGARAALARRFRAAEHASAEELVARADVDAVTIASPSSHHAEHALLAIEHGKPFYLEKPLAVELGDARRVLAAAAARGVAGALGFNYRRQPVFAALRALAAGGALGELVAVRTLFLEPQAPAAATGWRARRSTGGGVWLDLGSHHADLVTWLTGAPVVAVEEASTLSRRREHDGASARLALAGGLEAHLLLGYDAGPVDRVELIGRRAVATADRHAGTLRLTRTRRFGYGARNRAVADAAVLALRLRRIVQPSWEPSFGRALRGFARGVAAGSLAGLPTLADGAASLAVVLAAERAARDRRAVGIEIEIEPSGA